MGDKSGDRESERGGDAGTRRWGIKAGNGLWEKRKAKSGDGERARGGDAGTRGVGSHNKLALIH